MVVSNDGVTDKERSTASNTGNTGSKGAATKGGIIETKTDIFTSSQGLDHMNTSQ